MSKIFSYVWLLMMLMICFSLNSRSGRLLRHVPRQKPLSAHALRCKDTQKVDNQGRVVNFFEQKSAFSSGRRIPLSSTAFRANPLRKNLQCSQEILRCSRKIAQCSQESRCCVLNKLTQQTARFSLHSVNSCSNYISEHELH